MPGGTSPSLYFWGDLPDLGAELVVVIIDEGEHNWARCCLFRLISQICELLNIQLKL